MAKQKDVSTNDNSSETDGNSIPLNLWHIHGLAKRLGVTVGQLPKTLDGRSKENKKKYHLDKNGKKLKKYQYPSHDTVRNLKPEGAKIRRDVLQKIIDIVNAEMKRPGVPSWIPEIDMDWMRDPNPDLRWRQHIPNYVNWDDLVDSEIQNKMDDQLTGLYYLYRPHGLAHTQHDGQGFQRELLCIHMPVKGHIRVHRINKKNMISSGLGYREGNMFTVALYRKCEKYNLRSTFMMIHNKGESREDVMRVVMSRMSERGGAYASGAVLVRVLDAQMPAELRNRVFEHLRNERANGAQCWNVEGMEDFECFTTAEELDGTAPELEDERLKEHLEFLETAIFRLDDFDPFEDDADTAPLEVTNA